MKEGRQTEGGGGETGDQKIIVGGWGVVEYREEGTVNEGGIIFKRWNVRQWRRWWR